MKQILVISGKGGTGKTIITAALASLAENAVLADCDVDAADLHLLLHPTIKERNIFKSGVTAVIDKDKCVQCGKCVELCRFSAIKIVKSLSARQADASGGEAITKDFCVDEIACEGCAFCHWICPHQAIEMKENTSGEWYVSETRFGPMIHAKLGVAEENSGKLVGIVKKTAQELAERENRDWVIIDGAPGIGCPVIASLSGIDCAIVVTEPTLSGLHDAKRVIEVADHFKVPVKMVINKHTLNSEMTEKIAEYCRAYSIPLLAKVGFDKTVVDAMVEGKTIVEYSDGETKDRIEEMWNTIKDEFQ